VKYDRICCDVPCSSDAAIRKIPTKWESWNPRDSQSLHPLQLQILKRGIELLKVGGKITYSTCSLNPVENEAVVAAALLEYQGKIRLLEQKIPGFRH
jgi:16S rRNA C967 or C1407 C5-methylase (RsmB/RsmF family)